jgi:hypothetical protein
MEAIWIAVIVAMTSTVSPLLLAYLTNRQRRRDKLEDWARQDAVAAQARQVADDLLRVNRQVVGATEEANTKLDTANGKLDTIHGLANSTLTAAKQAELDAKNVTLVLMRELAERNGDGQSVERAAAIDALAASIEALQAEVDERTRLAAIEER